MLQTAGRAGELAGNGPAGGSSSSEAGNDGSSGSAGNGSSSGSGSADGAGSDASDGGDGQTGSWNGNQNGTAGNEESGQQEAPGTLQEDELQIGIEKVNSWGQGDESYYQYRLTLTNSADGDRKGWTIRLTFSGGIELNGSWNGQYQAEDNILTISSMDYNAFISKGGSVGDIGFIVKGGENLVIEGQ